MSDEDEDEDQSATPRIVMVCRECGHEFGTGHAPECSRMVR